MKKLIIAAPGSGQGKTTVTMGILYALKKRGLVVQPYKVGPDYIDSAFHTKITGRQSINLDSWLIDSDYIKAMTDEYSKDADISVIEGVMGLYDGYSSDVLVGSTAGISKLLSAPIVLVMECDGMAASAAAIVYGFLKMADIDICGVIINRPSSVRHYDMIKSAVEKYTGVKVIGYLPKCDDITLEERHLGLVQCCENDEIMETVEKLSCMVEEYIDLDYILSKQCNTESRSDKSLAEYINYKNQNGDIKIAVAYDRAFSFYYHENLEILRRLGATLEFFSPIDDKKLPEGCSGLYVGGGYPEIFAYELDENESIRQDILDKAKGGLPIYAECGGYMYLNKTIETIKGETYRGVGVFDGRAYMTNKLQNFGYATVEAVEDNCILKKGAIVRVHEFHKSKIERYDDKFAVKVKKEIEGKQIEWYCGMQTENVMAMYPHIYFPANLDMPKRFFKSCSEVSKNWTR